MGSSDWDARTGALRFGQTYPETVQASFGPDGEQFVTVSGGKIEHRSTATGQLLRVSRERSGGSTETTFSPDRRYLVVQQPKKPAELWSIPGRKKLHELDIQPHPRAHRGFSRDSRSFFWMFEGKFRSWVIEDPRQPE